MDLTDDQRDELGGIEYRSLKLLAKVLVGRYPTVSSSAPTLSILTGYYVFFHLFGAICFIPWINTMDSYKEYVESVGVNPTWWYVLRLVHQFGHPH